MKKGTFIYLVFLLIFCCLAGICAEYFMRSRAASRVQGSRYRYDPELAWIPVETFPVIIEDSKQKNVQTGTASGTTILFLGDSFTEGHTSFPAHFARRWAGEQTSSLRTVNAAVGGYSIQQEYLAFERYVPLYRPDMVVLAIYAGNDISDQLFLEPIYHKGNLSACASNYPLAHAADWEQIRLEYAAFSAEPFSLAQSLTMHSYAYRSLLLKARLLRIRFFEAVQITPFSSLGPLYPPTLEKAYEQLFSTILRMHVRCAQIGASLHILIIPSDVQIDKSNWQKYPNRWIDMPFTNAAAFAEDAPQKRLAQFCNAQALHCTDLLATFRTAKQALYGADDIHLSDAGHKLCSDILYANTVRMLKIGN